MRTKIFIGAVCFSAVCLAQGPSDSTAIKNKLLIDQLKNRINTIDNIGNGSNTFQKQIDDLKMEMGRQNDSITKLLTIINDLKKYAPANSVVNQKPSNKTFKMGAGSEQLALPKNMTDNAYNELKKSDADIQNYVLNCNCNPLFFKPYEVDLDYKTMSDLNEVIKKYESAANSKIVIVGHADKTGVETKNVLLSQKRAENLRNYLVLASDKIKKENITVEWYGSSKPIKDLPEEKQQLNRRTELIIQ